MSSILDALNKLEQEKTQAARDSEESELDPALTAHDLVGRSVLRDRVTLRVTPAALLLSVGALIVTLIIVTLAIVLMMMRANQKPETQVAANTPPPASAPAPAPVEIAPAAVVPQAEAASEPAPSVQQPPVTQTVTPPPAESTTTQVTAAAPPPSPTVVARTPDKPVETPAATAPEVNAAPQATPPAAAAPEPKSEPPANTPAISEASTEPEEEEPAPRTRVAAAPIEEDDSELPPPPPRRPPVPKATATTESAKDVVLDRLPIFTESDGLRYGFERIRINMMKPADATNPQGAAILSIAETSDDGSVVRNTMRFYEGQRIQQSPLRIFKVEDESIGIEDVRTGDRYQLRFR